MSTTASMRDHLHEAVSFWPGEQGLNLIPVELYDDAINSPAVAWSGQTLSLAQIQEIPEVDRLAYITDGMTAWIKAHADDNNDAPEMPRLVARTPGGPAGQEVTACFKSPDHLQIT